MTTINCKASIITMILSIIVLLMASCTRNHDYELTSDGTESTVNTFDVEESSTSSNSSNNEDILGKILPSLSSDSLEIDNSTPTTDVLPTSITQDTVLTAPKEERGLTKHVDKQLQVIVESSTYQDASIDEDVLPTSITQDTTLTTHESTDTKEELDLIEYVDKQLQDTIDSSTYQDANIDERKQIISNLLSKLKDEQAIKNFTYNNENYLFSFKYCDGTLGGVRIKDFDSIFN